MATENIPAIHYLDPNPAGSPLVLLLHGLGADSESWGLQIPALVEAGMRPLAVDLPGFGRSPLPPGAGWSIPWVAGRLAELIDQAGRPPVCVVGLSLGGVVAQQLALDYPDRVRWLVLANTFSRLRPKRWNELAYLIGRFAAANLRGVKSQARMVAWRVFPAPDKAVLRQMLVEKIQAADPRAYQSAMRALGFFNVRRRLKDICAPTLVISGERDTTVALDNQMDLARDIPGARQVILPDAGHAANVDQPVLFNQAILEFLRENR